MYKDDWERVTIHRQTDDRQGDRGAGEAGPKQLEGRERTREGGEGNKQSSCSFQQPEV